MTDYKPYTHRQEWDISVKERHQNLLVDVEPVQDVNSPPTLGGVVMLQGVPSCGKKIQTEAHGGS